MLKIVVGQKDEGGRVSFIVPLAGDNPWRLRQVIP